MCYQFWSVPHAAKKTNPSYMTALHAFVSRCEEIILRLNREIRHWDWLEKNWFWILNTNAFGKPEEKIWRIELNTLQTQKATFLVLIFCLLKQTSVKN